MKPTRLAGSCALGLVLMLPGLSQAAWNNVFQLTCCRSTPRTSARIAFAAPSACNSCNPCNTCNSCPQPAFVQRSFYQPVTAFRPVTTFEPVTSYRTSFFYEPVCSMSYSLYVDPCTGCAQQVATPTRSFALRSRCDAVTNYVARISYQPVTAYRQSFFMEPVTINPCNTCSSPVPVVAPTPVLPAAPPVTAEATVPPSSSPPPALNLGPDNKQMPSNAPSTSDKSVFPNTSHPRLQPTPMIPSRTASRGSAVTGSVVLADFRPQGSAVVHFVGADGRELPAVRADQSGRFAVTLTSGRWKIYTEDATGRPTFHSEIQVAGESRNLVLVKR